MKRGAGLLTSVWEQRINTMEHTSVVCAVRGRADQSREATWIQLSAHLAGGARLAGMDEWGCDTWHALSLLANDVLPCGAGVLTWIPLLDVRSVCSVES